jgi:hypothetical protein
LPLQSEISIPDREGDFRGEDNVLDILVIGLLQAAAGEPAAPSEVPTSAGEQASTEVTTPAATPTDSTTSRPRICRNVVSNASRLGGSRHRDCNRDSDASRSDRDQQGVADATARAYSAPPESN